MLLLEYLDNLLQLLGLVGVKIMGIDGDRQVCVDASCQALRRPRNSCPSYAKVSRVEFVGKAEQSAQSLLLYRPGLVMRWCLRMSKTRQAAWGVCFCPECKRHLGCIAAAYTVGNAKLRDGQGK